MAVWPSKVKQKRPSASARSSTPSTRSTRRMRKRWNGWYHSRSQWVWGTRNTWPAARSCSRPLRVGDHAAWRCRRPGDHHIGRDIVEDKRPDAHHRVFADGAGADHDGEAGQPGALLDDDVAAGPGDR